jgi:hypothetical protein
MTDEPEDRTEDSEKPAPRRQPPGPEDIYFAGTMAERVDVLMGVLTHAVVESVALAGGAYPALTEKGWSEQAADRGGYDGMPPPPESPGSGPLSSFLAARSAGLRDAALLSEASARLLDSYARYSRQFSRQSTLCIDDWHDGDKRRRHTRTVQRFFVAAAGDVIDGAVKTEAESSAA